jgi:hypothetical protein
MTNRDDVPTPADGDVIVPPVDPSGPPSEETPVVTRRSMRAGERPGEAATTETAPDEPTPDDAHPAASDVTTATRCGVFVSGATEWAVLADPRADAPGGPYSTGVSGHGADIGVLGTDSGSGTGVGVLGIVTNVQNSQPGVYGFTQGTGPGIQGESDGTGPGVLGTDNGAGTGYAVFGELTNPANTKAAVYGSTAGTGAAVEGDSKGAGPGIFGFNEGSGPGVRGSSVGSNAGVEGQSSSAGPGVLALNDGSGPALEVHGPATFSRSGLATIAAKNRTVTVSFPGVTATSMVLATLQTVAKGIAVAAAVPGTDSFTIKLTKSPKRDVVVAWFVLGS